MEYEITAERPFREIEAQTIDALERVGFVVQCTFRLVPAGGDVGNEELGYSVLMLYSSGTQSHSLGQVTLHERGKKLVLGSHPASPTQDLEADLVVALSLGGFEFCVSTSGGEACIDPGIGPEFPNQDRGA